MMTGCPSARFVSPDRSRAEMWTNTSFPPPSRAMKPKPFSALNHFTVPVSSTAMPEDDPFECRRPEIRSPWCRRLSGAAVDADDLGDVWSLVSWTDADFEGFTRLYEGDAALRQHAPMEEGVAGPIREFDKSKPLFGIEPFDHAVDWRTGGCLERLAEPGSSAESTGLKVVRVSV